MTARSRGACALAVWLSGLSLLAALAAAAGPSSTRAGPSSTVPFELLASRHIAIRVMVNGKGPYTVLLDTGSPLVMLSTKIGRECASVPLEERPGDGRPPLVRVVLRTLSIGMASADNVAALVFDHPLLRQIPGAAGTPDGIVGFPFLSRFRVTLDYEARTLSLRPNSYQPPDVLREIVRYVTTTPVRPVLAPRGQWGMVVRKADSDTEPGVTVASVWPGSAAAEAGIERNDRLLSIDGRWTDGVADCFTAASLAVSGKLVRVEIRRGGIEQTLHVTPRPGL